MMDLRDLTRLPADPEYWKGLEMRILADLVPKVRLRPESTWWAPLAARAWGLGGLALAAGLAALLLLPQRAPEHGPLRAALLGVSTDDPAMAVLVSASAPPLVAALVLPTPASGR